MIGTDQQRANSMEWVNRFRQSIAGLKSSPGPADVLEPDKREILIRSQESLLADLEGQVAEYDELRSGRVKRVEVDSFDELGKALIKARIAAGVTPEQLAERLGISNQEMERLERFDYQEATLARLFEVVRKLGAEVHFDIRLPDTSRSRSARSRKRVASAAAD